MDIFEYHIFIFQNEILLYRKNFNYYIINYASLFYIVNLSFRNLFFMSFSNVSHFKLFYCFSLCFINISRFSELLIGFFNMLFTFLELKFRDHTLEIHIYSFWHLLFILISNFANYVFICIHTHTHIVDL